MGCSTSFSISAKKDFNFIFVVKDKGKGARRGIIIGVSRTEFICFKPFN